MENKDELKEIDIEIRKCYCFDDVMRVIDVDFSDTLLDEESYENLLLDKKLYENILIYNVSIKTFMCAKPLRI